jgi:hypothetical protein
LFDRRSAVDQSASVGRPDGLAESFAVVASKHSLLCVDGVFQMNHRGLGVGDLDVL